jgi:lipid-A-disaccharide synthase
MRIFFSVGEPSSDLHGSNLIRHLRNIDPTIECVGFGGPKMAAAGCKLQADFTGMAVMLLQVLVHIRTFLGFVRQADEYFASNQVDAVILIDFPGFNWWIARKAKARGIPVFFYGVPQMWAWAAWRTRKLRRTVDHAICKLPFEPAWFAARGCTAHYVGHPFFDQLCNQQFDESFIGQMRADRRPLLLLLPGSRNQEVESNWEMMRNSDMNCLKQIPQLRIAVGCFRENQMQYVRNDIDRNKLPILTFVDRTPELMRVADVCIACSGSVSLELMYHKLPTVIVYKTSRFMMWLYNLLARCRYMTLVNLMASDSIRRVGQKVYDPCEPGAESVPMPEFLTRIDRSRDI